MDDILKLLNKVRDIAINKTDESVYFKRIEVLLGVVIVEVQMEQYKLDEDNKW